jgi:hypothetical protein
MTDSKPITASHAVVPRGALWPFALFASCFLWWGVANNITDPLVKVFKEIFGVPTSALAPISGQSTRVLRRATICRTRPAWPLGRRGSFLLKAGGIKTFHF